eukprot:TRINITY_DN2034_c4_g1_i2.p1 TRINITY_DN2034_c4_g1~~TRINITY_DN2034_c4_g1_i2.p1  ORF type:complete len:1843 (+),score=290.25 TRINITY_DN2034_c4_g1_i2:60-5588(+)
MNLWVALVLLAGLQTVNSACSGMTEADLPQSFKLTQGCELPVSVECADGATVRECGTQDTVVFNFCIAECAKGYVCRDTATPNRCTLAHQKNNINGGFPTTIPGVNPDTGVPLTDEAEIVASYAFLWFCTRNGNQVQMENLFGWNAQTLSDADSPCVLETDTVSLTRSLRTGTETFSSTLTDTITETQPTLTPEAADVSSESTSVLSCITHDQTNNRFYTGRNVICTFVARDAAGNALPTASRGLSATLFHGTSTLAENALSQNIEININEYDYELVVSPIAAEGPYVVEVVMVSEVWVGVEIRAVDSLHVYVGWDSRFSISCSRLDMDGNIHSSTEALSIDPLPAKSRIESSTGQTVDTTTLTNWLLVGESLFCELNEEVPNCNGCRLRMPANMTIESPDWEISPALEVISTGSSDPVNPAPITYGFYIKRLSLTERVLQFRFDGDGDPAEDRIMVGLFDVADSDPFHEYTFVYGDVANMTISCPSNPPPIRSTRPITPEIPAESETLRCTVFTYGKMNLPVLPPSPDVGGFEITFINTDATAYDATPNTESIGKFFFSTTEHSITSDNLPVTYIYVKAAVAGQTTFNISYAGIEIGVDGEVLPTIYSYEYPNINTTTVSCGLEGEAQQLLPLGSLVDLNPTSPTYICDIEVKDADGAAVPCKLSDLSVGYDATVLSVTAIEQVGSLLHSTVSGTFRFSLTVREQQLDYEVQDTILSVLANGIPFVEQTIKANRVYEATLSASVNGATVTAGSTIVSDNKEVVLDSAVTGTGTQSLAFKNFAKTYTWTCDTEGTPVVVGNALSTTISVAQLSAFPTTFSCVVVLEFEVYSVNETLIIEKNSFGTVGDISATVLEITNPETDSIEINCNGFTDQTSISYHVAEILGSSGPYLEPRIATGTTSTITLLAPRVSTLSYSIEVRCVAVNTFGTAVFSSNSIVVNVGKYVPPETANLQNDEAALILATASTQGASQSYDELGTAAQKLQIFDKSAASITLSAVQQVATSLVAKLNGLTTLTATETLKVTQTIQSLAAAAHGANVLSGTLQERDNANIAVGDALGILKLGTAMTRESIVQLQEAISGLFGTLAAVSAGRSIQPLLTSTQGLTLVRNIKSNLCTQGVALATGLPTGSCSTQDTVNVVDLTACMKSVNELTTQKVTTTNGASVLFNSVLDAAGAPLDKSLKVIEVFAQLHGDIFGFDASSKSLLGRPVVVCLYDVANKQMLSAPLSESVLQLPVTPITSAGYSFVDTGPNGAQYSFAQTKWDATNCVANLPNPVPSPATSLDATCTGLDVAESTFFAVLATGIKCIPAPIAGCIETNAATDLTQCKCITCGKGYIATPVNNGQGCQKDTTHRCDDNSIVYFDTQCIGGSILVNSNCQCPLGTKCTGTPGSCVATKNCGDIGLTHECIDSGLSQDGNGKCLCKPIGGLPSYCDSGSCKLLVKCGNPGNAANSASCGFGSTLDTQTGNCICKPLEEFCSSSGYCLPVLSCGMHPSDGATSCNSSLEYNANSQGVSVDTATSISFVIEAFSTSPVHPVTDAAAITAGMLENIKTHVTGDKFNAHTMAQGTTVSVRQETPETATNAASLVSLTLNRRVTEAEEPALRTEIVEALGIPDLTQAILCFNDPSGLTCKFKIYNEMYTPTNQTFDGACTCKNNVQCIDEQYCGCPICRNGGSCNWPTHGFDVHSCDCPVGWKGEDCSIQDLPRSRYFDYTFLTGTVAMYDNLNQTEAGWFKGNVSEQWIALLGYSLDHQIFVHAAQSNGHSLEVSIGFRVRDSEYSTISAAVLNTASARKLKTVISVFFNSDVGAALFSETLGCSDTPHCTHIPAHWTDQPCECLEQ